LLHVDGTMRLPPGGIVLAWQGGDVRIAKLPADVTVGLESITKRRIDK